MPAPFARILGTAQDGGLPQPGCVCENCAVARRMPTRARRVTSLGLVSADGRGFLVDATPDLPRQVEALPEFSGLLLTHGHMGHVAGLQWLGREAMAVFGLPVFLGERLLDHLTSNEPWATLFRDAYLAPEVLTPGKEIRLSNDLRVTPVPVPHRAEWSETFAFRVSGPERTVLWMPDIDRLDRDSLEELLDGVDSALIDGTFWSDGELPGRDMSEIPHPLACDTADLLVDLKPKAAVSFVHLNHTNPLWSLESEERLGLGRRFFDEGIVAAAGGVVAEEGYAIEI